VTLAANSLESLGRQRLEQRLAGREVAVDGGPADAGRGGDVVHGGVAVLGETYAE
jgi:hypothetical protein